MVTALAAGWFLGLLGRFHPLVIHFPVALLLAAGGLELAVMFGKTDLYPDARFVCLAGGALGSVVAAPLGWIDAARLGLGPQEALTLGLHRWLWTSVAALSLFTWILAAGLRRGRFLRLQSIYRPALLASVIAVAVGSHFGGVLVYGQDYYSSAFAGSSDTRSNAAAPESPVSRTATFERDIGPLFRESCLRCHGATKHKGRLRLDTREAALKGGRSGPAVVPGDGARSLLYQAITDPDPDTRMPQDAPPLPKEKIDLIHTWIDQGAH